jgi:hypothetical protein
MGKNKADGMFDVRSHGGHIVGVSLRIAVFSYISIRRSPPDARRPYIFRHSVAVQTASSSDIGLGRYRIWSLDVERNGTGLSPLEEYWKVRRLERAILTV